MEEYRSGHNGPHSKCGSPKGLVGSNPTSSANINNGMWLSLVEHYVRDVGAAGSNPVIPTITSVLIGFKKFYENTRFLLPYMFHTATQALVSK